jgi:subtilisin family serine protease
MSRFGLTLVAATAAALLVAPGASAAPEQPANDSVSATAPVVLSPDRVIVEWAAGASPTERRAAREEADVDFTDDLGSRRFQLVETEPGQAPREAVRELEADPSVVIAERDGYISLDSIPNDPLFDQLWGLQNTGLGVDGFVGAVAGDDINASGAWDRTVGTPSTVVADIDTGYRFEHPDLANVAWTNPDETLNGLDDDGNGIVDDVHGADFIGADLEAPVADGDPTDDDLEYGGHGIHTAGTIGAEGNNGIGITGVAQDVSLMPLRVCGPVVGDNSCSTSAIVEAINYAGEMGARVANMSFGSDEEEAVIRDAMATNPQTLYVISAGNDGVDNEVAPHYPCVFDPLAEGKSAVNNVICVAATDQADRLAEFSNWGSSSVDVGAPGTETLSTFPISYPVDEDFEADDLDAKWSAGPSGGFERTNEPPLSSYGISDSPGATPAPNSIRSSTFALTLPAGFQNCELEYTRTIRRSGGGSLWTEVSFAGETLVGVSGHDSKRFSYGFLDWLSEGGELEVKLEYKAGANPAATDGAWIDDVELHCTARLGEPGGYGFLQGTSMATPHVTGAAALLFSLKPSASVTEVRQGLLGSVNRVASLAGKTTSGGRLDISAAVDLFDAVPPPAPTFATSPPSPSNSNQPRLKGSAQPGTSVDVYANAACSGAPVASGSAAQLAAPGIAVTVGDDTVTEFSVRATDLAPHTSPCSGPISYANVKTTPGPDGGDGGPTPDPGSGGGGPTPTPGGNGDGNSTPAPAPEADGGPAPAPACVVPKLSGKTLAQAKAALKAAACKLGAVRMPRPAKGKPLPPLVVKSSTPAAGARPAGGKVNLTLGPKPRARR